MTILPRMIWAFFKELLQYFFAFDVPGCRCSESASENRPLESFSCFGWALWGPAERKGRMPLSRIPLCNAVLALAAYPVARFQRASHLP
jgi:hypothetical protein